MKTRYFWDGWFSAHSIAGLCGVFALLSLADLIATMRMMSMGVKEGNAIADSFLVAFGPLGFIIYKIALVSVAIGAIWVISRHRPRLGRGILWGGISLMGVITLIHLAIISGMGSAIFWRVFRQESLSIDAKI